MLDTNVLLDWLLDRDPHRTQQIEALLANQTDLYISDLVIVELVFALEKVYELPRDLVGINLQAVMDQSSLRVNRPLFGQALTDYQAHPRLSFLDCCLINQAVILGKLPVWTTDRKLINQSNGRAQPLS